MFRNNYRKELENLSLSEEFKQQTVNMLNENINTASCAGKAVSFRKKHLRPVAAAIALFILSNMAFFISFQDKVIGTDEVFIEEAQNITGNTKSENKDSDSLPVRMHNSPCYTINDSSGFSADKEAAGQRLYNGQKIVFNTETGGGMGFEGVSFYDISELDTRNIFSTEDNITSLPVYKFTPLSRNDIKKEYMAIIENLGLTEDSITSIEYEWAQMGKHNGLPVILDTVKTDSDTAPEGYTDIYMMNVEFEKGYIDIFPARGQMGVYIYDSPGKKAADYGLGGYVARNYTHILGENLDSYVMNDYDIHGNQDYNLTYVFRKSEDYAQELFNNSAGSIATWHLDNLIYAENDKGECLHFVYTAPSCYTADGNLPAIGWHQALDMFYSGNYISTVYEKVSEDTVVNKIELVYKEPPFYTPGLLKTGHALPFYKLYVELPAYRRDTEKGQLHTYGIYYVCAVHPDYVEYTEGYAHFN